VLVHGGQLAVDVVQQPVELGVHGWLVGLAYTECSIAFTAGHMLFGVTPIRFAA
jgi:hypothetical protein